TRQAAPLRAQALDAIRRAIVEGRYAPGTRLKERDLCETFAVSRTVIREALRQLESERLIHIEPQVGPTVSTLTLDDARALYEVRSALEATAGKLAARNGSDQDVTRLASIYDEITLAADAPMSELRTLKNTFYAQLVATAGNPVIGEMPDNVQARISQLRRITLSSPDRHRQMVAELARVVEAIEARDADAAFAACVAHVKSAELIALRALELQTESTSETEKRNT